MDLSSIAFAFTASKDSNLVPLNPDLTFGKRKESKGDVPSLEYCFLPNNSLQIARCELAHCPNEGSLRHSSTSLVSFVKHVHGGPSKHFYNKPDWQSNLQAPSQCSCCWVLQHFLTSQVISVAFYIEREKSDRFHSETLISAWGSLMCHKSMKWDKRLYFPSEGSHTQQFYALKKSIDPGWVWTCKPRVQWQVW